MTRTAPAAEVAPPLVVSAISETRHAARRHLHHPNVVLRVAGLPFSAARRLVTGTTHAAIQELEASRGDAAALVSRACDHLERAIGRDDFDTAARRKLLEIKRSLFNNRPAGLATRGAVLDLLEADAAAAVREADAAVAAAAARDASLADTYADENGRARETLRALCLQDENFLRALAFSAPMVTANLLEARENPDKYTGKRGRNLDSGLFNYFLRATTKVSPLTYFTPVLVGRWNEGGEGTLSLDGREARGAVEVSRRAVNQVLEALSLDLRFWGEAHPLQLNPTIEIDGDHIQFKKIWSRGYGSGRTWGVHHPTSRMPANPRLIALHQWYNAAGPDAAFSLRELFEALGASLFPNQPGAFAGYAAQAVRAGILVPVIDIFEQEDVLAFLGAELDARAPEAAASLRTLNAEVERYQAALHRERLTQFAGIQQAFMQLCASVGADPAIDSKSPLIYEDCTLTGSAPAVPVEFLGTAIADLHRLSALFPMLDYNHVVQSVTASLFRQRFGDDAVVAAATCIESIADEAQGIAQRLTPLPPEQEEREIGLVSETAEHLLRQKRLLLTEISARMKAGGDVVLDDAFIDRFAAGIPARAAARATSYTVIGQTADQPGGSRFVINRLYSGHSMLMSRFLRGQDEAGCRRVSDYLATLSAGTRPVEIPGVFGFNANIHPQFLDTELSMTGRRPNYRGTEKIPVEDLTVRYDARFDRLAFGTARGGDVAVHYLGFLNLMVLPNIYQVLGRMNLQGLIIDLWQDLFWAGMLPPKGVTPLPRVSYGGVVLSRRSLFVPAASMPAADGSELDFFKALHAALREWGQSGDHFVRLVADHSDFVAGERDGRGTMADTTDFKPALLSLDMPLTVASLQRRLQRRARGILLQEALPEIGSGGINWNGDRHACEVQLEISRTAER